MNERVEAFLKELDDVSKKHGLHLWACSCCNAINVVDTKTDTTLEDCILYDEKTQSYGNAYPY